VGNHLFHTGYDEGWLSKAADILEAYKVQGWKVFGVKFTHVLQEKCWRYLGPIFKVCWPDAKYVIAVRHPAGIIKSLEGVDITPEAIIESWMSTYDATKELIAKGAIVLLYPDSFMPGTQKKPPGIKLAVEKLGLKWSKKADVLLDKKVLKKSDITVVAANDFKKKYPEAAKMYDDLSKHAI